MLPEGVRGGNRLGVDIVRGTACPRRAEEDGRNQVQVKKTRPVMPSPSSLAAASRAAGLDVFGTGTPDRHGTGDGTGDRLFRSQLGPSTSGVGDGLLDPVRPWCWWWRWRETRRPRESRSYTAAPEKIIDVSNTSGDPISDGLPERLPSRGANRDVNDVAACGLGLAAPVPLPLRFGGRRRGGGTGAGCDRCACGPPLCLGVARMLSPRSRSPLAMASLGRRCSRVVIRFSARCRSPSAQPPYRDCVVWGGMYVRKGH